MTDPTARAPELMEQLHALGQANGVEDLQLLRENLKGLDGQPLRLRANA